MHQHNGKAGIPGTAIWLFCLIGLILLNPNPPLYRTRDEVVLTLRPAGLPIPVDYALQLFSPASTELEEQEEVQGKPGKKKTGANPAKADTGLIPPFICRINNNTPWADHTRIPLFILYQNLKIPGLRSPLA